MFGLRAALFWGKRHNASLVCLEAGDAQADQRDGWVSTELSREQRKLPGGLLFSSAFFGLAGCARLALFGRCFSEPPALMPTVQAFILLVTGHRWGILHTEYLIYRFTSQQVIIGKPAFSIKWAAIFVLAPVDTCSRVFIEYGCQKNLLPYARFACPQRLLWTRP